MDASNAPVRRPPREMSSADVAIDQKGSVENDQDRLDTAIVVAPEVFEKDLVQALKFNEEPVTIRVERSSEKYAPNVVDCWCNGKGAEVMIDGRWVETKAIPVGMPVTTKRKYVEILLRSKIDTLQTQHEDIGATQINNNVQRYTSARAPVTVIEDRNPLGTAWFTSLARANY